MDKSTLISALCYVDRKGFLVSSRKKISHNIDL